MYNILNNLPAIIVVLPMVAAAFCVLIRNKQITWVISLLSAFAVFICTILLFKRVEEFGVINYYFGNFSPPFGIEYRIDLLNSYFLITLSLIFLSLIFFAKTSIEKEVASEKRNLFLSLYLLCFAGLMGIVATNDIFNIYVFLEISSLATYSLIAMGKDMRSLKSSFEYLILGTIGATFILIGIGFLYIVTGTLNISDMAQKISYVEDERTLLAAFIFLIVGIGLKIAIFPLHVWLVKAYSYAPSIISAFLAAVATKVMLYLMIRFSYDLFGYHFAFKALNLDKILMICGISGILVGSISALYQENTKKILAFSSLAQIGYILLLLGMANHLGLVSSLLFIFNHALAKALLFVAIGAIYIAKKTVYIEGFVDLRKKMPITIIALFVGAASLVGIPGTAGFVSKWMLLKTVVSSQYWPLLFLVVATSFIALIYMWRILKPAYFDFSTKPDGTIKCKESRTIMVTMVILIIANIYFGLSTEFSLGVAEKISESIFGNSINLMPKFI